MKLTLEDRHKLEKATVGLMLPVFRQTDQGARDPHPAAVQDCGYWFWQECKGSWVEKREPFQQTVLKYWKAMNDLLVSVPLGDTAWLLPRSGNQTPKLRQSCVSLKVRWKTLSENSSAPGLWAHGSGSAAMGTLHPPSLCISRFLSLLLRMGLRNCSSQDPWFRYLPHKVLFIDMGDQNVNIAATGKDTRHNKWQKQTNKKQI